MMITEEPLADEIFKLGLSPIDFGSGLSGLGKLDSEKPNIVGICSPIDSHLALLSRCEWYTGTVILVGHESPRFTLWDQFFCLETTEFPQDLLQLRDHFDYTIEHHLKEQFSEVKPMIGPAWLYLFPCEGFIQNLKSSNLKLSTPFMGNAFNCKSDSLTTLLDAQKRIRKYFEMKLPLPMIWAFPADLPIGNKDNFYDRKADKWYVAEIKSDFKGSMSLVDLRPDENGVCNTMQHDFEGNIHPINMNINDLTVHFTEVNGKFRSRRKLSRLKLNSCW